MKHAAIILLLLAGCAQPPADDGQRSITIAAACSTETFQAGEDGKETKDMSLCRAEFAVEPPVPATACTCTCRP